MNEISSIIDACINHGSFILGNNYHDIKIRDGDLFAKSKVNNIIKPITMSTDTRD